MDRWTTEASLAGRILELLRQLQEIAERAETLNRHDASAKLYHIGVELIELRRQLIELPPPARSAEVPEAPERLPF